jgi:hypothetical protein
MLCGGPRTGIFLELAQTLNKYYDISGKPDPDFGRDGEDGRNHWYLPSSYVSAVTGMVAAEKNITLMCGMRPIKILVSDGNGGRNQVKGVLARTCPEKVVQIKADITIDATGTGEAAAMAGCKIMYGRESRYEFNEPFGTETADEQVQRCTWMYISQRVNPDAALDPSMLKNRGMVEDKIDHWVGNDPETPKRNAGIYLHWGATVQCRDTRDRRSIADAQREALAKLEPDMAKMREKGFAVHLAPRLGVREVRRVRGEHVLTVTDMKSGKYPDDVIAFSDYGIDAWGENITREQIECPRFGIPFRSLIPVDTEGLLIAGKSISGTHLAASSYRVQPIVSSIGQAAGLAAAYASRLDTAVRDIPVAELQKQLKKDGVLIN